MIDRIAGTVFDAVRTSNYRVSGKIADWNETEWCHALDYARKFHVLLIFLVRLEEASLLPKDLQSELRRERMLLALLDHEFELAASKLLEEHIPVLVVKGMDLGRRLYPSRSLRPMKDVDFLVLTHDFLRSVSLLETLGYKKIGPFPKGRFRLEMARDSNSPTLEIHHRLLASHVEAETEALWSRSVQGDVPGLSPLLRRLNSRDALIYLIRHSAMQHALESLVWFNDLDLLIRTLEWNQLMWQDFAQESIATGLAAPAWTIFTLLKIKWETPVPDSTIAALWASLSFTHRLLGGQLRQPDWWFIRKRDLAWLILSRYFLRGSNSAAFHYGLSRFSRSTSK